MSRPAPSTRDQYRYFHDVTTRWMDNDVFGHVNNVVYYSWVDTGVNRFLMDNRLLDLATSTVVGIVAETGCRYISEVTHPDLITVGVRVAKLGNSSVRYEVAIFRQGQDQASAEAHFVHVYVDRATMRPVPIPAHIRAVMQTIMLPKED